MSKIKIHLECGELKGDVTVEDARSLFEGLRAMFGKDEAVPVYPLIPQPTYPWYSVAVNTIDHMDG